MYHTKGLSTLDPHSDSLGPAPEILIGHYNSGYNLEFSEMYWSVPPHHLVRVNSLDDNDRVSIASLEAIYGGNRATMLMLDDDESLVQQIYRQ